MSRMRPSRVALAAAAATALLGGGAQAHPHVWVATKTQVIFENGALTGLRYTWMFDEMYTTSAVEGLDKNNDGRLDPAELEELTKVNIEGLKEFEYFTTLSLGGEQVQFADPKDYAMEVIAVAEPPGPQLVAGPGGGSDAAPAAASERRGLWSRFTGWIAGLLGRAPAAPPAAATAGSGTLPEPTKVLALHMTLPLKSPIPASRLDSEKTGFLFSVNDPQLYIAFEPSPKDGIAIAPGAPEACRIVMVDPVLDEQQKKLQEAFGRLGGPSLSGFAKNPTVVCAKP